MLPHYLKKVFRPSLDLIFLFICAERQPTSMSQPRLRKGTTDKHNVWHWHCQSCQKKAWISAQNLGRLWSSLPGLGCGLTESKHRYYDLDSKGLGAAGRLLEVAHKAGQAVRADEEPENVDREPEACGKVEFQQPFNRTVRGALT
jgi:hypothetical protein